MGSRWGCGHDIDKVYDTCILVVLHGHTIRLTHGRDVVLACKHHSFQIPSHVCKLPLGIEPEFATAPEVTVLIPFAQISLSYFSAAAAPSARLAPRLPFFPSSQTTTHRPSSRAPPDEQMERQSHRHAALQLWLASVGVIFLGRNSNPVLVTTP